MSELRAAITFDLRQMPPGQIWTHPRAVGSSMEELSGPLTRERMRELFEKSLRMRAALESAEAEGCSRWWLPPWKLVN